MSLVKHKWWTLTIIGTGEILITLDNSIVNIALPSAQAELGFSDAQRPWVVTAYALAFGSLLLLGGRISDIIGRKSAFLAGMIGFAIASVIGGVAPNFEVLVTARALQGIFAALVAPAALALLTTTFPDGRDRTRAFGVFAALAVSGGALGLLLGGLLTEYVSWRACLFVSVVFAVVGTIGGIILLPLTRARVRPRLDLPGTATAVAGVFLLVLGFSNAESGEWAAPQVSGLLAAGVVMLTAFVLIQRKVAAPLLPLRVILNRYRGGAFITGFVTIIGMFGIFLFLTYVMQEQLGFSPLLTGVSFLPMTAALMIGATQAPARLLPRVGPKVLLVGGLTVSAGALYWLSFLSVDSTYGESILGPLVLMGLGMGTAISTLFATATSAADPADAGVTSAVVSAVQQIGASVGTALLASIAVQTTSSLGGVPVQVAVVTGYAAAFGVASAIFAGTAVLVAFLVPAGQLPAAREEHAAEGETAELVH